MQTQGNNTQSNDKLAESKVFVSKHEDKENNKTIVGLGSVRPYTNEQGENVPVSFTEVMGKINNADNFVKGMEMTKMPLTLKVNLNNEKKDFYTAFLYEKSGTSEKTGQTFNFKKMRINLRDEIKNDAGEIIQRAESVFLTKNQRGVKGYSMDSTNDKALMEEFMGAIKNGGVEIQLSVQKNETLEQYPKFKNFIDKIPNNQAAIVPYQIYKTQGIIVDENKAELIKPKEQNKGAEIISNEAKIKNSSDIGY